MATSMCHPDIERVRVCTRCTASFVERTNTGRMACRMHADRTLTRDNRYTCCLYPLHDMQFALELRDGADFLGCLPCDHTDTPTAQDPPTVAMIPHMYIQREFILKPPVTSIAADITADMMRQLLERGPHPVLTVVRAAPAAALEIDIVDVAFRILINFVASDYWNMKLVPDFAEPRARIEAAMRTALVADTWNPNRDTQDNSLMRMTEDDARTMIDDDAIGTRENAAPTQSNFNTLTARLGFVKYARNHRDTAVLLRCFVPFMVIRRVADQKWVATVKSNANYNERMDATRSKEWKPLRRHDIY